MIRFTADWLLPIAKDPIRGGAVTLERNQIVAVPDRAPADAVRLGRVALLPALVNAHTHLELSHLQGCIPPSDSFDRWVRALMALRRGAVVAESAVGRATREAIDRARALGTGLIGDVSNTLVSVRPLEDAGMASHVFYELIGFTSQDPVRTVQRARKAVDEVSCGGRKVRVSLAPHAPYSVSPALFKAIKADVDAHPPGVTSVHLGESVHEVQLLRDGTGPVRDMLESLGAWPEHWRAPALSPTAYLDSLGFLDARTLVVHGVQFDRHDLSRLVSTGATLVCCPRSNAHVGVGSPPLERFYSMEVPVAFGTDSLASVEDLNMFNELAEARRIAPRVPARSLLRSATLVGARALGFETEFGSIEAGKRAALISVRVPEGVNDVEEYLVSGVEPGAIDWLHE